MRLVLHLHLPLLRMVRRWQLGLGLGRRLHDLSRSLVHLMVLLLLYMNNPLLLLLGG